VNHFRFKAKTPRPFLSFTDQSLRSTVAELCTTETLLVTDDYNYPKIGDLGRTVAVEDTDASWITEVTSAGGYSRVIAIGGCTALDFGRACARGKWLAAIPTILSNCCLSSNRSVIRREDRYISEETTAPNLTVISLPTMEENHADQQKNWSASGLGDLFSAFAAVAEANWDTAATEGSNDLFRLQAPICWEALEWINSTTYPLDRVGLEQLARFLHEFSIVGHKSVPIGSEHMLYYLLRKRQNYSRMVATHGKLVSIGTLITLRAWSEATGDFSMYDALRLAFSKVGLPLTFGELKSVGVAPEHILSACIAADSGNLYSALFHSDDTLLLTRVFAPETA
jgi:glycerol dehydrogenase-like iron-containing ADH family enzyme